MEQTIAILAGAALGLIGLAALAFGLVYVGLGKFVIDTSEPT